MKVHKHCQNGVCVEFRKLATEEFQLDKLRSESAQAEIARLNLRTAELESALAEIASGYGKIDPTTHSTWERHHMMKRAHDVLDADKTTPKSVK